MGWQPAPARCQAWLLHSKKYFMLRRTVSWRGLGFPCDVSDRRGFVRSKGSGSQAGRETRQ